MNRHQYRVAYREDRKLARFIITFDAALKALNPHCRTFPRQSPDFCFTRLHKDFLHWNGSEGRLRYSRTVNIHRNLLFCIKVTPKPRLP